ncbi:MAG: hypothetical protein MUE53_06945 [Chitinophagales bacterium]|jgi:hypothetical protein|nr:hypothetical protein [Chitinophagales bacterium]
MKLTTLLFTFSMMLLLTYTACQTNASDQTQKPTQDSNDNNLVDIKISKMETIGEDNLIGCSCIFRVDSTAKETDGFELAMNLSSNALININGETVVFTLENTKEIDKKNSKYQFKSEKYNLTVDLENLGGLPGKESEQFKGSMLLESNLESKAIFAKIYGYCGC